MNNNCIYLNSIYCKDNMHACIHTQTWCPAEDVFKHTLKMYSLRINLLVVVLVVII